MGRFICYSVLNYNLWFGFGFPNTGIHSDLSLVLFIYNFFLFQGLIDGRVEPEIFTTKLQKELNSSPQPCLVPFLKKSLPYLQHSLATLELSIEGVRPPPLNAVGKLPPAVAAVGPPAQLRINTPAPGGIGTISRPVAPIVNRAITPIRSTFTRPGIVIFYRNLYVKKMSRFFLFVCSEFTNLSSMSSSSNSISRPPGFSMPQPQVNNKSQFSEK